MLDTLFGDNRRCAFVLLAFNLEVSVVLRGLFLGAEEGGFAGEAYGVEFS